MFRLANVDGRAVLLRDDHWYDLEALTGDHTMSDPMHAIAHPDAVRLAHERAAASTPTGLVADVVLGPPMPRPSKVFAIGLNYRSHAAESNLEIPTAPVTFTKFPSCLAGPTSAVPLSGDTVDWEVELVVVIGHSGHNIAESDAWSHVAGLMLGQDISDRTLQMTGKPAQFSLGKSYDGYGPTGPAVVSLDAFDDPDDIGLWSEVSGERMQEARTSDLIFGVPELIAYLSAVCTLHPGDLIFTGTPGGVGAGRGRFLHEGDVIVSGAEVIGEMRNPCVNATGG